VSGYDVIGLYIAAETIVRLNAAWLAHRRARQAAAIKAAKETTDASR
jgi:hypothetical protein